MRRAPLFLTLALGLLGAALGASSSSPPPVVSQADGLAAFETVRQVLQHPRCQNCHIPGDAPFQFDAGKPHAMNVLRGKDGKGSAGLACGTCHGSTNPPAAYGDHMPPGAPNWHLPPPDRKMVFIGLSAGELCLAIQDRTKNGGRDLAALTHHVEADKLVLWGWNPGEGRAAVPVSHADFVAAFKTWAAAGAPCPTP